MNTIEKELCNFMCIKEMGDAYLKKWKAIRDVYAETLDKGSIYRPIAYTYHDYTHHCYNIYKIVSKEILYNPNLTAQEWFILNTAILLHDISMTISNFDRLKHSKESADWLLENIERDSVLKQNLLRDEAEVIALIISAHSDCKEKKGNKEEICEYTLENSELKDRMDCGGAEPVRAKFLAAILRIADECDVTRNRLDLNDNNFEKLDDNDSEQKYSKEQWLQLRCFKSLHRDQNKLILETDDAYINKNKHDEIEIRIRKVGSKIRKQIRYVREQCITSDEYSAMFQVQNVVISSSALRQEFIKEINNSSDDTEEYSDIQVGLLDEELEKNISDKIDKDKLKKSGHYIVTENCCERDWIELRDIVVDKKLSKCIIEQIEDEIKKEYQDNDNIILVAMEENSLILTSQIAYRLGKPFSYIIPCNYNQKKSSKQEKAISFEAYDKIILVTDAVATFQTLGLTCDEYGILDKLCGIYTILYRETDNKKFVHKQANKLASIMTACCKKYPSEVHDRKKCSDNNNGQCIAANI